MRYGDGPDIGSSPFFAKGASGALSLRTLLRKVTRTDHGTGCVDAWLGANLKWDLVHVNFGLHDLNDDAKEVPIETYKTNLATIFDKLKATGAKLIFQTTTPVPAGDGGGKRTEANVALYNSAALEALAPDIQSGRVAVHDLHGDIGEAIRRASQRGGEMVGAQGGVGSWVALFALFPGIAQTTRIP